MPTFRVDRFPIIVSSLPLSGVEAYLTNEIQNFIKIVLKVNDFRRETSNTNYEIEINNSPAFQNKTTVKNRENLF